MNTETNNNQRLRPPSAQPRALSLAKCIAAEIEGSFFISVFLTLLCSVSQVVHRTSVPPNNCNFTLTPFYKKNYTRLHYFAESNENRDLTPGLDIAWVSRCPHVNGDQIWF